jgi:hypothetical protein
MVCQYHIMTSGTGSDNSPQNVSMVQPMPFGQDTQIPSNRVEAGQWIHLKKNRFTLPHPKINARNITQT